MHTRRRRPEAALTLIEIQLWSGLARLLLATLALERTLRLLDALPSRAAPRGAITPPPETAFRLAGACLGRSLARSQFLRVRGYPSVIMIGVEGAVNTLSAHAWLDGDTVERDFVELRRIKR